VPNINSMWESCGKLAAEKCRAESLASNSEQAGIALAAGAIVLIQPQRVSSIFAVSSSGDSGTAIPLVGRNLPYDSEKEDLPMDRNRTQSTCVGWAKQPGANAIGGVPTNRREDISKKWWARRRCAFAHPTDRLSVIPTVARSWMSLFRRS
jgi:hypothetical protein